MRIASSALNISATSASQRFEHTNETRQQLTRQASFAKPGRQDSVQLSSAARELAAGQSNKTNQLEPENPEEAALEPRLLLAAQILARFFGRDITVFVMQEPSAEATIAPEAGDGTQASESLIRIQRTSVIAESESVQFRAQGQVQTGDGRSIELDVSLNLERSWVEVSHLDITATEAVLKDPLVLNLSGSAAKLGEQRFEFDLSASGARDSLPVLDGASAFLVMDRNGNGKVDDGTELFGALSGDGFADLARLDDDRNGWIDQGDQSFSELRLWLDAGRSGSRLQTLGQLGVGAISLDHVATPFSLKDPDNNLLGMLRATGVFLYEDGRVGTAQQIDLAV
jgi:hypothetical protein